MPTINVQDALNFGVPMGHPKQPAEPVVPIRDQKDKSIEDLLNVVDQESGYSPYLNAYTGIKLENERKKSVDNASAFDKLDAFSRQFLSVNFLAEGVDQLTREIYPEDPKFKETFNDAFAKRMLEINRLPITGFPELRQATSQQEMNDILQRQRKEQEDLQFVTENLGTFGTVSATLAGGILDIDTALTGPLAGIFGKGAKLSTVMKATGGVETGAAVVKSNIRDDYDFFSDGVFDIATGVMIDTAVAKYFKQKFHGNMMEVRENGSTNQAAIDSFVADVKRHQSEQAQIEWGQANKVANETMREKSLALYRAEQNILEATKAEKAAKKAKDEAALTEIQQTKKALEKERIQKSNEMVKARNEQKRIELEQAKADKIALDNKFTAAAQERKLLEKKQVDNANELVRIENELKALELEQAKADQKALNNRLTETAQKRKILEKQQIENANELVRLENELKAIDKVKRKDEYIALEKQREEASKVRSQNALELVRLENEQKAIDKLKRKDEYLALEKQREEAAKVRSQNALELHKLEQQERRLKLEKRIQESKPSPIEIEDYGLKQITEELDAAKKELKAASKTKDGKARVRTNQAMKDLKAKVDKLTADKKAMEADAERQIELENIRTKESERQRRIVNQINDIARDLAVGLEELKARIKNIADNIDDETKAAMFQEFEDIVDRLTRRYPEETKGLQEILRDSKRVNLKNNGVALSKKLSGKQKAALIGLGLTGSAFAGDNTDDGLPLGVILLAVTAAYVGGGAVIDRISHVGMRNALSSITKKLNNAVKLSTYKNSVEGEKTMGYVESISDKFHTAFNSTYKEMVSYGAKAKEIADRLLFDPTNGKVGTADIEKMQIIRGEQAKVRGAIELGYEQYIDSLNIGSVKFFQAVKHRETFNKLVSRALEGEDITAPGVKEAASEIKKVIDYALDSAIEAEVFGAKDIIRRKGYLPRLWKFNSLHQAILGTDDAGRAAIQAQLAKTIKGPNPNEKAAQLISWFKSEKQFTGKALDDLYDRIDDLLNPGVTKEQLGKELLTEADKASRLKDRIEMDLSKFEPVKLKVNDIEIEVKLEDIVERDVEVIMDKYLNQMFGQVVLARRGYKSIKMLREEIAQIPDIEGINAANTIVDLLLGQPLKVNNKATHEIVTMIKAGTFVDVLNLVAFSMLPEAFKSVANAGLAMTLKNFTNLFKKMNKDSALFKTLTELTGLGTHSIRDKLDFKGLDQSDLGEIGVSWGPTRMALKAQEFMARASGLVKFSDVFQRLTLLKSATDFANFVHGNKHGIPLTRLDSYGINDSVVARFKDDFKFDKNGELLDFDTSKWSFDKRAQYNDIMFRLNQEITPETVIGTIGRFTKDNDVGRLFAFLINYPLNLYANQWMKDAKYMDARAMQNVVLTFAGTYLGLAAKYEALGKDYQHEDLVKYSIMNLPVFGILSSARSLMDPAAVSEVKKLKQTMDTLAAPTD